jgi:hypothetical protein
MVNLGTIYPDMYAPICWEVLTKLCMTTGRWVTSVVPCTINSLGDLTTFKHCYQTGGRRGISEFLVSATTTRLNILGSEWFWQKGLHIDLTTYHPLSNREWANLNNSYFFSKYNPSLISSFSSDTKPERKLCSCCSDLSYDGSAQNIWND